MQHDGWQIDRKLFRICAIWQYIYFYIERGKKKIVEAIMKEEVSYFEQGAPAFGRIFFVVVVPDVCYSIRNNNKKVLLFSAGVRYFRLSRGK